ncbi:hypothetical protein H5410_059046 [Solanum commersonii]|uniref:HTH myb-type domain-containing protein n=1 Tax=Solanum commersonii TaxID=4109 RepID=A0A9J5W1R4_SOLCO|nr:hypothetical protein H5410_059046 [Solanum commersonii]
MFPPPPYPIVKIGNYQPTNDIPFLEYHGSMRLFGGLNTINNNNNVNYYDPFIVNPNALNFNVAHQVQQEVGQQPNNVGSASRVKPPRMFWTDELHRKFVDVVDKYGGPWAVRPRHILREMEHMGISRYQIKNHLQNYRAKLNQNDVGGRKRKASSKKELIQDVQEQLKNVDGWKADVYIPQLPTEAEMMEAHISPEDAFMEELLK